MARGVQDVEVEVDDEKRKGRKKKITVMEYEYDADMEGVPPPRLLSSTCDAVDLHVFQVSLTQKDSADCQNNCHLRKGPYTDTHYAPACSAVVQWVVRPQRHTRRAC